MIGRVDLKLQEVAPSWSYALNPLDLRSGRSESYASQPRASRVIPPNPTRPARSHLCFKTARIGFRLRYDPTGCQWLKSDRNQGRSGC